MRKRLFGVGLGLAIIALAALAMVFMFSLKEAPAAAAIQPVEKALHVEAITVQPEDVPVMVSGYGRVRAVREVQIAPEVSGRVTDIHPRLAVGGTVAAGEVLFAVDPEPYAAAVADTRATATQQEAVIARLELEHANACAQRELLERTRALAEAQFQRTEQLLKEGIGSQAEVERAEQELVRAQNEADQAGRALELYPLRLAEARGVLQSAQTGIEVTERNLRHTRITAPFAGRVKQAGVEQGQIVAQGTPVVTLADDSALEISVPLDARDARFALEFEPEATPRASAWFSAVKPAACRVRWTEDPDGAAWEGQLERVESYDETARTITVAVRVAGHQASPKAGQFPLVAGMFCRVDIAGKPLERVYRVPAAAVTLDNTLYLAAEDRLKTVPVAIARAESDFVLVSQGLHPGDRVITTRLVNPLDHSLLNVVMQPEPQLAAAEGER
ncbi:MAG: efflux RND transporter periplasmic adaptor subunit [Candidatus Hydrogenedentes bacterium]|nr:efflux RND transporter periplasmic adaptor subunit [Candidatus Hydrogenedentota bacterium]